MNPHRTNCTPAPAEHPLGMVLELALAVAVSVGVVASTLQSFGALF